MGTRTDCLFQRLIHQEETALHDAVEAVVWRARIINSSRHISIAISQSPCWAT